MRWRLLLVFLLMIVIALGVVSVVARYTTQQEVRTFLGHGGQVGLENLARSLEDYYDENGSWQGVMPLLNGGAGKGPGRGAGGNEAGGDHLLLDAAGEFAAGSETALDSLSEGDINLADAIPLEVGGVLVGYLVPEGGMADLPDNFESLLIERVNRASLLAALISGAVAIPLAFLLSAMILRPVFGLTRAAESLAAGDLSQRVIVRGNNELAVLASTFNQMADSLQAAKNRRQALTADIAHELRNPLAVQRAHLEALQDGIYAPTPENLDLILQQNQQLTYLVEDLRTLALADSGALSLHRRWMDLVDVCEAARERFLPQARQKNIALLVNCPETSIKAQVDRERLQQILDNLLQNAIRHTPEGGQINLTLDVVGDAARFAVHDSGSGIPETALPHIFDRFYRVDKGRDRVSGGTGLGLSIARKLAEVHGGTLTADNHPTGGAVFELVLPLDQKSKA